jgi:hypothetical protein
MYGMIARYDPNAYAGMSHNDLPYELHLVFNEIEDFIIRTRQDCQNPSHRG